MTNDTALLLTCTSCHVNCVEYISHIPPQWFFSWVTMPATLTTIQDPPCNANGLIILQQWISAGINMSCSVQDVIWCNCKWVEMHGQKRAEKGWSRETLGKGHFYPVNYKLYFRLPTCSAYNTISWFAIRRSIRVPKKKTQAHTLSSNTHVVFWCQKSPLALASGEETMMVAARGWEPWILMLAHFTTEKGQ